jgi:uncharacterized SAM-binding protein YcdF (DUF218 family)
MVDITQTSDTTPFTQQPISSISVTDWSKMTRAQLEDQKYKLQHRLSLAYQLNNNSVMVNAIQMGINQITGILENCTGK